MTQRYSWGTTGMVKDEAGSWVLQSEVSAFEQSSPRAYVEGLAVEPSVPDFSDPAGLERLKNAIAEPSSTLRQSIDRLRAIQCEHGNNPMSCTQCHSAPSADVQSTAGPSNEGLGSATVGAVSHTTETL